MKALLTLIALTVAVNVSFAAELGEASADCTSMVQSNRSVETAVVSSESAQVEASESAQR